MEVSNSEAAWLISPSAKSAMTWEMSLMTWCSSEGGRVAARQRQSRLAGRARSPARGVTARFQAYTRATVALVGAVPHSPGGLLRRAPWPPRPPPCCPGWPGTRRTGQTGSRPPAPPRAYQTCCSPSPCLKRGGVGGEGDVTGGQVVSQSARSSAGCAVAGRGEGSAPTSRGGRRGHCDRTACWSGACI